MQTIKTRVVAILTVSIVSVFALRALKAEQSAPPQDPGEKILLRACTVCHNTTEITKFKGYYSRDQWADVVRTMRADGAVLQKDEVPVLVDYIFKMYGKKDLPDGEGKNIIEASCTGCHDAQKATGLRLSRTEWQNVISRMTGLGANLADNQIPTLVDYLSKNFGPTP
jgi:cytochrome c5